MMVKVFTPNKFGKIEFTKGELETLLNEVYQKGYSDANWQHWTWTSPTITYNSPTNPWTITTTTSTDAEV